MPTNKPMPARSAKTPLAEDYRAQIAYPLPQTNSTASSHKRSNLTSIASSRPRACRTNERRPDCIASEPYTGFRLTDGSTPADGIWRIRSPLQRGVKIEIACRTMFTPIPQAGRA